MVMVNADRVGWRFRPEDVELIDFFLRNKINGKDEAVKDIKEIDICKWDPWDLPDQSAVKSDDKEWFFFYQFRLKSPGGKRLNRSTPTGFWKPTGNDRKIRYKKNEIGLKKILTFHEGRAPNCQQTKWVMHEYRATLKELDGTHPGQRLFVVCRLFNKDEETLDELPGHDSELATTPIPNEQSPLDLQPEPVPHQMIPVTGQEGEQQLRNSFDAADMIDNVNHSLIEDQTQPRSDEVVDNKSLFADPNLCGISFIDPPMTEGTTSRPSQLAADNFIGNSNTNSHGFFQFNISHLFSFDSCENFNEGQDNSRLPGAGFDTPEHEHIPQYVTPGTDGESLLNSNSEAEQDDWMKLLDIDAEISAPSQISPPPNPVSIWPPEYQRDVTFGASGSEFFGTSVNEEPTSHINLQGSGQPQAEPAVIGGIYMQGTAIRRLRYQTNLQVGELKPSKLIESDEASSLKSMESEGDEPNGKEKSISSMFSRMKLSS